MFSSFYENFNTTNVTSPLALAHESFVTNSKTQPCGIVHLLPSKYKCKFVTRTEGCHDGIQFIDYMNFLFCTVDPGKMSLHYLAVFLLILECIYLFVLLGTTADKFFCPALAFMADSMGLNEDLAGVTLLAFGNGSPDIFTALADYEGDTEMLYAELFGAAIFIVGIIAALIIIIRPFTINGISFIRDVSFFLFACWWIGSAFRNNMFTMVDAVGTLVIYMVYLCVVIGEHVYNKWKLKATERRILIEQSTDLSAQLKSLTDLCHLKILKTSKEILYDVKTTAQSSFNAINANDKLFYQFFISINPIDMDEWNSTKCFGKCLCLIKAPANFFLIMIIPIVDYTEENHGWSKLLNMLHVCTLPIAVILLKNWYNIELAGIPIYAFVIIFAIPICVLIYFTSRTDRPAKYHWLFAIFGSFVGSIIVISVVATEVVSILSTLGIVSNLSHSMLGLSVLAWGNSIGDLMANVSLARQGYTKMGFAACFGGPMFNSLLGMGIVFILKISNSEKSFTFAREGAMGPNCAIFLFALLFFTALMVLLTKFQARRSTGIFMVIIYCLFLLFCILGEFEIIHPYGTDHRDEGEIPN